MGGSFPLGKVLMTWGVNARMSEDSAFSWFVLSALQRYQNEDWGDVTLDDALRSDSAVVHGDQIMGAYDFDEDTTIWIITEWDRSVTTILFPHEY